MATTTNYGFTKPVVSGDTGAWGGLLNTDLDLIDTAIKARETEAATAQAAAVAAQATATAALPKAGGTMTGQVWLKVVAYQQSVHAAVSGTVQLSRLATLHNISLSGSATFEFIDTAPNAWYPLELWINNPADWAMAFTSTIIWNRRRTGSAEAPNHSGDTGGPGYVYHVVIWSDGTNYFGDWERY